MKTHRPSDPFCECYDCTFKGCDAHILSVLAAGSARWEKSEWPHMKFQGEMRRLSIPLPDVIWLRYHGKELTGWSKNAPKSALNTNDR